MTPDGPADSPPDIATAEDVRSAIESLSSEDFYRIRKAARAFLYGSEFADTDELINETVARAMNFTNSGKYRRWPKNVRFVAFIIQTMSGIADDSRNLPIQMNTQHLETMATEGATIENVLHAKGHSHVSVESELVASEESEESQQRAKKCSEEVDAFFGGDDEVNWIIMGLKDDLTAAKIRELAGMSQVQYETARRRYRRGIEKLSLGWRTS